MNLKEKRTLQFELWQECNNLCTFCYLGKENRKTPDSVKIEALQRAIDIVSDMSNYPKFNCIGLIGGEFFQGQLKNSAVKALFYKLIDKIAELYNNGTIEEFWVSATLTIGKQKELYEILGKFKDTKNVWVVTSWDAVGRFKTKKMLDNWEYHVKHLREVYPDLKVNCCIVLSGVLIEKYLSGEFGTFMEFALKHDISLFFKQPSPFVNLEKDTLKNRIISIKASNEVIPNFHPTRKKFLEFLIKFKNQESENLWGRLFNVQYRSDELIRSLNNGTVSDTIREKDKMGSEDDMPLQKCGHTVNYMPYSDEVRCCICDKLKIGSFS
jgi:hypothetical protein